ncbi:MAG TPA: FKBP-type peptidyl-prolyl cis-trans isomerase [Terriglobales bacterium]|nr:FKBP-type peptidyl-prolyl cis-trans isomerase [Terriglobales bacterium]
MRFMVMSVLLMAAMAWAQKPTGPQPAAAPPKAEGKGGGTVSGTQYWDLKVGTGKKAIPGFTLRVHYTGWLRKKKDQYEVFDSSVGKDALKFDLGMGRVIKGWDEGIAGMRVGGRRLLVIPPEAAYGREGSGKISGNATLIFEVELVEVR